MIFSLQSSRAPTAHLDPTDKRNANGIQIVFENIFSSIIESSR